MMYENVVELGSIATVKGGKRLPKGVNLIKIPNGHPYIRVRDIPKGKTISLNPDFEYVDNETQKGISRYVVSKGDIILSIVGSIGFVAVVDESLDGANLTENCVKITEFNRIDRDFLYYYLMSNCGQEEIAKGTVGAVQAKLPIKNIQKIKIPLLDIKMQQEIASALSVLDDKIELNQKINENLERQAQALYKAWFVDGKAANGFLSDICQYSKEKIAVSLLDLDNYYSTENMLPGRAGATQAAGLPTTEQTTRCRAGDVLVSNIRPYFKKIVYCYTDCGCSTDVLCFTPKQKELSAYLYFTLYLDGFFDFMVAGSKGTKMPRGDKQQIKTYPIYIPTGEEMINFNSIVQPILRKVRSNREENKRLNELTNTLLPKLMTGEIDVRSVSI